MRQQCSINARVGANHQRLNIRGSLCEAWICEPRVQHFTALLKPRVRLFSEVFSNHSKCAFRLRLLRVHSRFIQN